MTRTSAAGHPLQQAVSFLFLFLLLFLFSLISLIFRQCFFFFSCVLCTLLSHPSLLSLCVLLCLFFLTFFFPPLSKLSLFKLFFSWSPLAFLFFSDLNPSFFSASSSSIYFLNSFWKNLSHLLFISCSFLSFLCFSVFSLPFVFFLLFTCFLWTSSFQNRLPLRVYLFLVFSTPCFDPFVLIPLLEK